MIPLLGGLWSIITGSRANPTDPPAPAPAPARGRKRRTDRRTEAPPAEPKPSEPFVKLPKWIAEDPSLSGSVIKVYIQILGCAHGDKVESWPGNADIAKKTGLHPSTVRNVIRWLLDNRPDLLERERARNKTQRVFVLPWKTPPATPTTTTTWPATAETGPALTPRMTSWAETIGPRQPAPAAEPLAQKPRAGQPFQEQVEAQALAWLNELYEGLPPAAREADWRQWNDLYRKRARSYLRGERTDEDVEYAYVEGRKASTRGKRRGAAFCKALRDGRPAQAPAPVPVPAPAPTVTIATESDLPAICDGGAFSVRFGKRAEALVKRGMAVEEPVAEVLAVEPVAEVLVVEPVAEVLVVEPVAEVLAVEPVAEVLVVEPVAEVLVAEPVAEVLAVEPVAPFEPQGAPQGAPGGAACLGAPGGAAKKNCPTGSKERSIDRPSGGGGRETEKPSWEGAWQRLQERQRGGPPGAEAPPPARDGPGEGRR